MICTTQIFTQSVPVDTQTSQHIAPFVIASCPARSLRFKLNACHVRPFLLVDESNWGLETPTHRPAAGLLTGTQTRVQRVHIDARRQSRILDAAEGNAIDRDAASARILGPGSIRQHPQRLGMGFSSKSLCPDLLASLLRVFPALHPIAPVMKLLTCRGAGPPPDRTLPAEREVVAIWCSRFEHHNGPILHHLDPGFVAFVPHLPLQAVSAILADCVMQQLRSVTGKVLAPTLFNVGRDANVLLAVDKVGYHVEEHATR